MIPEQRVRDIEEFYDYVSPVLVSVLDKDVWIKTKESFVTKCIELNQKQSVYSTFRIVQEKRDAEHVIFLKNFVIDIDDDPYGEKARVFEEEYCKRYSLRIGAKVSSGGGYHYYIPYKKTIVDNDNREKIKQISNNFREHLKINNVDVDLKIFDLARLIRVWGTWNFKRDKLCELIYTNNVTEEEITNNTLFINTLQIPDKPIISTNRKVTKPIKCDLFDYIKIHKLSKENTEKNNVLIKNLAAYLYSLKGEEGYDEGVKITIFQGKTEGEFKGWWRKTVENDFEYNHNELYLWVREHYPELIHLVSKNKKIIYTDTTESFNALKQQILQQGTLIINREVFIKGKVEPYITTKKEEFTILEQYEVQNKDKEISYTNCFIDNMKQPQGAKLVGEINIEFYVYNLTEHGSNYLLLSETPLDFGEYYIEGSLVKLRDDVLIGNYGKAKSKKKILFCHNSRPLLRKYKDAKEMFENIKCTKEQLLQYLFYHKAEDKTYTEPEFLSNLLLSFIFSGKKSYPLHLLISGPPACGKSSALESVFEKFDEGNLDSGGASTIKNLVPSFGGNTPKLGSLLSAHRLCFVDEFLGNIYQEQNNVQLLRIMNEILEARERRYGSGKGVIDNAKMKAKLIAVTNPIEGMTFEETIKVMPETVTARIFVVNLGDSMNKWTNGRQHFKDGKIEVPLDDYTWLSIYDYMNSFVSRYDEKKILDIVQKLEQHVPLYMRNVYNTRYKNHHSFLLLDGIVKMRCLFEKDVTFEAKDEDYAEFEKLWSFIIENYSAGNIKILTNEQQLVLNLIGTTSAKIDDLKEECSKRNIDYAYNVAVLKSKNLISEKDNLINRVQEKELVIEGM